MLKLKKIKLHNADIDPPPLPLYNTQQCYVLPLLWRDSYVRYIVNEWSLMSVG